MSGSSRFLAIAFGFVLFALAALIATGVIGRDPDAAEEAGGIAPLIPGVGRSATLEQARDATAKAAPPPRWHELPVLAVGATAVERPILTAEAPPNPFDRAWARQRLADLDPTLEGIAWSDERAERAALLRGRAYHVGDEVGSGFEITAIDREGVTLEGDTGATVRVPLATTRRRGTSVDGEAEQRAIARALEKVLNRPLDANERATLRRRVDEEIVAGRADDRPERRVRIFDDLRRAALERPVDAPRTGDAQAIDPAGPSKPKPRGGA